MERYAAGKINGRGLPVRSVLVLAVLALIAVGLMFSQNPVKPPTAFAIDTISCGDTITASVTLTHGIDCTGFDASLTLGRVLDIGADNIVIDGAGFTLDYSGATGVFGGIVGVGHSGVTIKDLTFVGPANTYSVYFAGDHLSLLTNTMSAGKVLLDGVPNGTIVGNSITASPGDALVIRSNSAATYTITDNDLSNTTFTPLSIERAYGGMTLTLERNTFDGSRHGPLLNHIKGPFTLSHTNTFVNAGYNGGTALRISGEDVTVDGWSFSTTNADGGQGVFLGPFPCAGHACSRPSERMTVSNNTITGFSFGIRASKQQSIELSGNVLTSVPAIALWVDEAPPRAVYTITGNDLSDAGDTALDVRGVDARPDLGTGIILTADGNTFDGSRTGAALDSIQGPFELSHTNTFANTGHSGHTPPEDLRQGRDSRRLELQFDQCRWYRYLCTSLLVQGPRVLSPVAEHDHQ